MTELGNDYSQKMAEEVNERYDRALTAVQQEGAIVTTLPDREKQRWINGLPDIATRWVQSAEARGHPANKTLRTYMSAFRARGGQPLRNWDIPR